MALRLGGLSLGPAPWRGPVSWAESADGEVFQVLSPAAAQGLAHLGVDAALLAPSWAGGVPRKLAAPAVDRAALTGKGFTDHEIAAVEEALAAGATTLRSAFAPAVVGAGFVRDVLGAAEEALADPAFDTLALAGFSAPDVAAAQAFVLGAGSLAEAQCLNLRQQGGLSRRRRNTRSKCALAMLVAVQPFLCSPAPADLALAFGASPEDATHLQAAAAGAGVRALRLRRAAAPAGFALDLPPVAPAELHSAAPIRDRIVERIVEVAAAAASSRPAEGLYPEGRGGRPQGLSAHRRVR